VRKKSDPLCSVYEEELRIIVSIFFGRFGATMDKGIPLDFFFQTAWAKTGTLVVNSLKV